jgi:hypothetical protein
MSIKRYAVLKCGAEWKVVGDRRKIGHFPDQESANLAAWGLCREAMSAGLPVELLTLNDWGELVPKEIPMHG